MDSKRTSGKRRPRVQRRPRVLIAQAVSPDKIGGMEVFAVELARQLRDVGWDATLSFEDDPGAEVRAYLLSPGNVELEVIRNQVGMGWRDALRFVRVLRRHRPAAVLYSLGGVVRWWAMLGAGFGVRRSVYFDQTSRTQAAMRYKASRGIRMIMAPLSLTMCATQFIRNCSDREEIVPASKSRLLYSAVDTRRVPGDGHAFRAKYGIPEDRIVVLTVSWLVPDKGIDVALRAAARVLAARSDVHFLFCGDGAYRQEYERLADDLGISQRVTWTGQVQRLFESGAFAAADLQIQCSQWHEAFCLGVAEGMSASLPVIAARIGGLPELVAEQETGLLFEPQSDEELAQKILRLAADGELRRRMGAAGRARMVERHDLVSNVGVWVKVLTAGEEQGSG